MEATAQLNANSDISLAGNWTATSSNLDPFDQGAAAELVTFDGSSDQTISHTGGEIFNRVAVAKAGGNLILNNPITISNGTGTDLTLTQGKIISTSTNLITVADDATTNGGDSDSYIDGPIRKVGRRRLYFSLQGMELLGKDWYYAQWSKCILLHLQRNILLPLRQTRTSLSGVARVSKIEYWQLTRSAWYANK